MCETKICTKCTKEKPLNSFRKAAAYKDGYQYRCKACVDGKEPHKPIVEGLKKCKCCEIEKDISEFGNTRAKGRPYKASICKSCKSKKKEIRMKNVNNRTESYIKMKKKISMKAGLKKKYNLSLEDYNRMLKEQNNVCKICNKPEIHLNINNEIQRLSVDHCHTTGKIRGLLCKKCNSMLGQAGDDIDILLAGIEYLKDSQK